MKDIGLSLSTGLRSFGAGMQMGDQMLAAKEGREWDQEVKSRTRQQWEQQDAERESQQRARQLSAAYRLVQSGAYDPDTPQGQKMRGYVGNMINVFDNIENPDPQLLNTALQAFNERHAEDINKGAGTITDAEVDIGGGQKLPKGSRIERKQITRAFPRKDGSLLFGIKTTAIAPDGTPVEWENFVTQNRSSAADDPAMAVPIDSLYRSVESDMTLMDLVEQQGRDKTLALLEAELMALGGEVPRIKAEGKPFSAMAEGKPVMMQRFSDGSVKPLDGVTPYEGATTAERNFSRAQSDPAFSAYQERMRRAGATNVNVGSGEREFDKNLGKQMAEQYGEIQKGAQSARSKIATLDALNSALQGAGRTGTGAKAILAAKRALGIFGGDPNVSDEEAVLALGNQLALQMRNPSGGAGMPGALSDKDREFLVASVPGLEKTASGNQQLINYMKRIEQRSIEVAKRADEYMRKNDGRLDFGFYDELSQWAEANPLFPEAGGAAPQGRGNQPAPQSQGRPPLSAFEG